MPAPVQQGGLQQPVPEPPKKGFLGGLLSFGGKSKPVAQSVPSSVPSASQSPSKNTLGTADQSGIQMVQNGVLGHVRPAYKKSSSADYSVVIDGATSTATFSFVAPSQPARSYGTIAFSNGEVYNMVYHPTATPPVVAIFKSGSLSKQLGQHQPEVAYTIAITQGGATIYANKYVGPQTALTHAVGAIQGNPATMQANPDVNAVILKHAFVFFNHLSAHRG